QMRFASKKSGGSTQNGRTSNPKYLGFKKLQGAKVIEGNIILRQRGRQWHPGTDVGIGKDHTLFALNKGRVVIHYDLARNRRFVSVD
ncbi:ribosomal protein L27, partial [Globomyces pollinis-pini]